MAEARESTSKQLYCPICLETFSSPKSLPCMHTFCEKCICKHVSDLNEKGILYAKVSCPVCWSSISAPMPEQNPCDWAAKLPYNSAMLSLSASTRTDKDSLEYCEPCATISELHVSVAFCVTCSAHLCQTCYNCHKSFKISRDHQITVHSVLEHKSSNSKQGSVYICQAHNDKYTYYCLDHRDLCCNQCALENHRKCKEVLSAEDHVSDLTDNQAFKQALENLDVLRKMFLALIDNRTKILETIPQQKSDIVTLIADWPSFIKEQVDKLETSRMFELDQICRKDTMIISDQVVECKCIIAAIDTSQRMLVESTQLDDKRKIFVTLAKISQHVLKYLQKYDRIENESKDIKIGFQRNENLEEIIKTLGSLLSVSCETPRIPKLFPGFSLNVAFKMPPRVQLNSTVYFSAGNSDCGTVNSAVFLPDKRIVLYDSNDVMIKLFDKHFRCVSHLQLCGYQGHMCIVDKRTVAISAGSQIHLASVSDSLELVRSINVNTRCYGIASYQENLMVCVGGDSIQTYDASYKVSKIIKLFDKSVTKAFSVSPDGQRIHYTVKDTIVTMDMNGEKLETFESEELKDVVAITVDTNGIIYCCGQQSNNVVLFTPEGRKICVLLSGEHGLKNPRGMCLNDRNNKLLVFQRDSSEIKVFTLV